MIQFENVFNKNLNILESDINKIEQPDNSNYQSFEYILSQIDDFSQKKNFDEEYKKTNDQNDQNDQNDLNVDFVNLNSDFFEKNIHQLDVLKKILGKNILFKDTKNSINNELKNDFFAIIKNCSNNVLENIEKKQVQNDVNHYQFFCIFKNCSKNILENTDCSNNILENIKKKQVQNDVNHYQFFCISNFLTKNFDNFITIKKNDSLDKRFFSENLNDFFDLSNKEKHKKFYSNKHLMNFDSQIKDLNSTKLTNIDNSLKKLPINTEFFKNGSIDLNLDKTNFQDDFSSNSKFELFDISRLNDCEESFDPNILINFTKDFVLNLDKFSGKFDFSNSKMNNELQVKIEQISNYLNKNIKHEQAFIQVNMFTNSWGNFKLNFEIVENGKKIKIHSDKLEILSIIRKFSLKNNNKDIQFEILGF
ncbi:MAG: hypothetical protein ISN64_02515 [Rickettsia sp.]|nr:hypothetical protein [Rickettsia sp.]